MLLTAMIAGFAAVLAVLLVPPIHQDPAYHAFADQRTLWGVPNFWNVISNLAFLAAALWGLRALRRPGAFLENWERAGYAILVAGCALTAFGSAYYHLRPDNRTLFWDRLPMTIVFMALLAITIGERVSVRAGRWLLAPLLVLGAASVLYWRWSDDLRPYAVVQFFPLMALPLMLLLFPPRYTHTDGIWAMIGLYGIAKLFELFDHQIGAVISTGGHPWKHVAGGAAMFCYLGTFRKRALIKNK